jgi:hypothetical protein
MSKVFRVWALPSALNEGHFSFISEVGSYRDDAVLAAWELENYETNVYSNYVERPLSIKCKIVVIDSRNMSVLIEQNDDGAHDVLSLFTALFRYANATHMFNAVVDMDELGRLEKSASYGQIVVDGDHASMCFMQTVGWYRDGQNTLFVIEKRCQPVASKLLPNEDSMANTVGGLDWEDKRSYLRFENINRIKLSVERYRSCVSSNSVEKGTGERRSVSSPGRRARVVEEGL